MKIPSHALLFTATLPSAAELSAVFEQRQARHMASETRLDAMWQGCVGYGARGAAVPLHWLEWARDSLAQTRPAQARPLALLGAALLVPVRLTALAVGAVLGAACGHLVSPMRAQQLFAIVKPVDGSATPKQKRDLQNNATILPGRKIVELPTELWSSILQKLPFDQQRQMRRVSSLFFQAGEGHGERYRIEKEIIVAQAQLRRSRGQGASESAIEVQQAHLGDLFKAHKLDVEIQTRSASHKDARIYDAHEDIVDLFATPAKFWDLPLIHPRLTRQTGGGTGYIDYLDVAKDFSAPIMRGYARGGDRPFLALRLRSESQNLFQGQMMISVLFQRYTNGSDWQVAGDFDRGTMALPRIHSRCPPDWANRRRLFQRLIAGFETMDPSGHRYIVA